MKWGAFRDGIQILDKYVDDDAYALHAEHDRIYAGPEVRDKISVEDRQHLYVLGWCWHEETESYYAFT